MQGYFNAPEQTAETLRNGWLWTGDLGFLDEEGYLFITGRKKDIINCAGERISPREIEDVLESHANVVEAAVVSLPDPLLGETVAAVVVEREKSDDATSLNLWCRDRLSYHKTPRRFRFVEALPRTASGKVKKFELRNASDWSEGPTK
jgi:long-chain acyl-CoA synthetase